MPPGIGYPPAVHPITGESLDPSRPLENLMLARRLMQAAPELAAQSFIGSPRSRDVALAAALFGGDAPPIDDPAVRAEPGLLRRTSAPPQRTRSAIAPLNASAADIDAMSDAQFAAHLDKQDRPPRREAPMPAGRPSGELPRDVRLARADRILAEQPGAAEHQADLDRSQAFVRLLDRASGGGQRGVRGAELAEIQGEFPDKNVSPVGTVTVGGGDMDYQRRQAPPEQFRGGISAAIAGLGAPFPWEAPPEAVPDFEGRPSDPSELGRRTQQILQIRDNPEYQRTLSARQGREAQIAANMAARRAGSDPYEGSTEFSPAELRLLMRRNPALGVQAQQQQADRASRSGDAADLADYRGQQLSIARGELADRRRESAADRDTQLEVARIQAGARGDRLSGPAETAITTKMLTDFEAGTYGDTADPASWNAALQDAEVQRSVARGETPATAPVPKRQVQTQSTVEGIIAAAQSPESALDSLGENADPATVQRLLAEKFDAEKLKVTQKSVDREFQKLNEYGFSSDVSNELIRSRLAPLNKRRRLVGLPVVDVADVKRYDVRDTRSALRIPIPF